MNEHIKNLIATMRLNPPATDQAISATEVQLGIAFPTQYREFMLLTNGAEGRVGESSYLAIWQIEEIVQANIDLKTEEFTPGLILFASDRGGTGYAFDKRHDHMPIVEIPEISIDIDEAVPCGDTLEDFIKYLYHAE